MQPTFGVDPDGRCEDDRQSLLPARIVSSLSLPKTFSDGVVVNYNTSTLQAPAASGHAEQRQTLTETRVAADNIGCSAKPAETLHEDPVNVAITGGAGQIGYALAFRVASGQMLGPDQPVNLHLLEITPALGALQAW